ncbi:MAG: hypothetical protein IRZ10_09930 [Thermoflavifilum sp.]|nr:hypothetical protein [Thermoflavifilum sp.]MCL6514726.1 hypothetical protein [Alicyclobacillus sp.]
MDDTALRLPSAEPSSAHHVQHVPVAALHADKPPRPNPAYPTVWRDAPSEKNEDDGWYGVWCHGLRTVASGPVSELGVAAMALCTAQGRVLDVTGAPRALQWLTEHGVYPGASLTQGVPQAPQLGRAVRAVCGMNGEPLWPSGTGGLRTPIAHATEVPWLATAIRVESPSPMAPDMCLGLWASAMDIRPLRAVIQAVATAMREWLRAAMERSEKLRMDQCMRDVERLSILTSLAAGIAHEIRNPLTTARGFLQLFAERLASTEDKQFLMLTIQELDRIHRLVADFMSLAKPSPCMQKPVDVCEVLRSIAEFIRPEALLRNVALETMLPAAQVWVTGDEQQLKQVLLNIAQNALQACDGGGKVVLTLEIERDEVEIRVCDTGCGIPAHALDKVFQPFYTTKPTGTGLGLAISKRIVEEHGGCIHIHSGVGEGTIVSIRLPRGCAPMN